MILKKPHIRSKKKYYAEEAKHSDELAKKDCKEARANFKLEAGKAKLL